MPAPAPAQVFSENVVSGAGDVTIPLNVPANTHDGELLYAQIAWRGDGAHSNTEAAFTERVDNTQGLGPSLSVHTRIAASEPAGYNFAFSGAASRVLAFMARILGTSGVEDVQTADGGGAPAVDFVAPSVTSLGPERLLMCAFVSTHTDSFTVPEEMSFYDSNNSGGGVSGIVRYNLMTEIVGAGPTGTRTAHIAVARNWVASSILFAPSRLGPDRVPRSRYPFHRSRMGHR
jgi:hypothetical protein